MREQSKIKQFDYVELTENGLYSEKHTHSGVFKGMIGVVVDAEPHPITEDMYVIFSDFYPSRRVADIPVKAKYLKVHDKLPLDRIEKMAVIRSKEYYQKLLNEGRIFHELDRVVLTREDPEYAEGGAHEHMFGTIMDARRIDRHWLVIFEDCKTMSVIAEMGIHENDMRPLLAGELEKMARGLLPSHPSQHLEAILTCDNGKPSHGGI